MRVYVEMAFDIEDETLPPGFCVECINHLLNWGDNYRRMGGPLIKEISRAVEAREPRPSRLRHRYAVVYAPGPPNPNPNPTPESIS